MAKKSAKEEWREKARFYFQMCSGGGGLLSILSYFGLKRDSIDPTYLLIVGAALLVVFGWMTWNQEQAIATAEATAREPVKSTLSGSRIRLLVAIVALVSIALISVYKAPDYTKTDWMGLDPRWAAFKKKDVSNRRFFQETVLVDGHRYINCTFENVTFLINGTAPYEFGGETTITGRVHIKTDNRRLGALLRLLEVTNSLSGNVKSELGEATKP